jgi:fatty-acyl-CoA synthase
MLSHEAVVRHGINVQRTKFRSTADDRFWDPLPLFHIGGIVPMLGCLGIGATYYHAGHFEATQALDTLEHERITVAYPAFETIWLQVLDHPRFPQADLGSLRLIQNIAIPERLQQMHDRLPTAAQVSSFGATECSSNLTLPEPDDPLDVRIATLGAPVPGMEIRIVDLETGAECSAGERGELCLRGYARFEGYYKDPELTAKAIDDGGWFHTGDLGSIDAEGRLTYGGRLKDMLKVGGENVSALEVEDYLARHPAVQIVQVVGVPDARYEEVPAAFVELRAGGDRLLHRPDRDLQDPPLRALRHGVADVRDEDPEIRAARDARRRANRERDRRSAADPVGPRSRGDGLTARKRSGRRRRRGSCR